GQVVLTTNAPPMNEMVPAVRIVPSSARSHHAGVLHTVTPEAVREAVELVWGWPLTELERYQQGGRAQFLRDDQAFQDRLSLVLSQQTS
ncbi:MAG: hypothetical protein C5B54_05700, partial [Acidobacteria bacterium]